MQAVVHAKAAIALSEACCCAIVVAAAAAAAEHTT